MAADWIKMQKCTPDKPEPWAIATHLDIDPDAVVGKLFRVWCWFDEHTENGHAPSVTKKLLDREVSVPGFCAAMESVGWMLDDGTTITLPNFDRHNGESAKKRALSAERKRRQRDKCPADVPETSRTERDSNVTREEKRREEKNKEKPLGASGDTPKGYTEEFEALWKLRPRRDGPDSKHDAFKAYRARLRDGHTHREMADGLARYRAWLEAKGKINTEYVKQTQTFLGPAKHFKEPWTIAQGSTEGEMSFAGCL